MLVSSSTASARLVPQVKADMLQGGTEVGFTKIEQENPWLASTPLVVKPDQLIKRRGKAGLLAVNKTWPEVQAWISERMGKTQQVCALLLPVHVHSIRYVFIATYHYSYSQHFLAEVMLVSERLYEHGIPEYHSDKRQSAIPTGTFSSLTLKRMTESATHPRFVGWMRRRSICFGLCRSCGVTCAEKICYLVPFCGRPTEGYVSRTCKL